MKQTAIGRWIYIQRRVLTALWCMVLIGLPVGSYATAFSTADFAVSDWNKMHDHSMAAHSIYDQCLRIVSHDKKFIVEDERVTADECQELADLVEDEIYTIELIPDGIVLPRLTGLVHGAPGVMVNKRKQLGRIDQAKVFVLTNGTRFVFFDVGRNADNKPIERCFNLALLPMQEGRVIPPPAKVVTVPSRIIQFSDPISSDSAFAVTGGIPFDSCCCGTGIIGGSTVIINNPSTVRSRGYSESE